MLAIAQSYAVPKDEDCLGNSALRSDSLWTYLTQEEFWEGFVSPGLTLCLLLASGGLVYCF